MRVDRSRRKDPVSVLAQVLCALLIGLAVPGASAIAGCFKVMDATLYAGKPDMAALGIQSIKLVEPPRWWHGVANDRKALRDATIRAMAPLQNLREPLLVDLELPLAGVPASTVAQNRQRYIDLIHWMRDSGYTAPLAFYGSLPVRDYWRAQQGPNGAGYRAWQAENDGLSSVIPLVNALYPSLYTFYDDPQGWVRYAQANIAEARRLAGGRPVYPFIWPQYHNSNARLAYRYIDGGFWTQQLQTLYKQADGLVLWGGWDFANNRNAAWDENAAWWQATKQFLRSVPNLCSVTSH